MVIATMVGPFIKDCSMFIDMIEILPTRLIMRTNRKTSLAVSSSTDPYFITIGLLRQRELAVI